MNRYLPVNASEHGAQIDGLIWYLHYLMIALFVGWGLFYIYTLYRFNKTRNPKADYTGVKNHYSSYLEVCVVLVEAVLLVSFSIPLWANRVDLFPPNDTSLQVNVVAEQFNWNIHYAGPDGKFGKRDPKMLNTANPVGIDRASDPQAKDDITVVNQLHLPVNKPVIIRVTSKDVIHSFSLQEMRVKQDAIPGQVVPLWFVPIKTSVQVREEYARSIPTSSVKFPAMFVAMKEYKGKDDQVIVKALELVDAEKLKKLADAGIPEVRIGPLEPMQISCAQLCGIAHYRMKGVLVVETQEEFDKWIQTQSAAAAAGGNTSYD